MVSAYSAPLLSFFGLLAHASWPEMAGYEPETNVIPHSRIDLDMDEIVAAVATSDWTEAERVYSSGGCGYCSADDIANEDVKQCFEGTTDDPYGCSVKGSGAIRTIEGFALSGPAKMMEEKWYPIYKDYWGDENYSDTFVRNGLTNSALDNQMRTELVKKGAAYQAVWMYVLHEFEDAIMDCENGDIFDNDHSTPGDAPHAWDEGWAFYAGSMEGTDGDSSGQLLYALAEKRCQNFGTCTHGLEGEAKVNVEMLKHAKKGRDLILHAKCSDAKVEFEKMVDLMTVPLVQGTLRYAFKADPANELGSCGSGCPKAWAEGWAFAAAMLPRIDHCDSGVATMLVDNFDVANSEPMKHGYVVVKESLETVYDCLGITCEQVGELQSSLGVYPGMEQCGGSSGSDGLSTGALIGIIVGAVVLLVLLLFIVFKACSQPPADEYQKNQGLVDDQGDQGI